MANVKMELDGSRDKTFDFWTRLQRIQYDENPKIVQRYEALNAALAKDDSVSNQLANIASKHQHVIQQLGRLDAANVAPVAISYRNQLVAAHQTLIDLIENERFVSDQASRKIALKNYIDSWGERYAVMETLKDTFDWEFDYVE